MIRIKIRDPKLVKLFGQTLANRFIKTIYHENLIGWTSGPCWSIYNLGSI